MRLHININISRHVLLLLIIIASYNNSLAYASQVTPKAINSNPATLYAPLLLPWQAALTSSNVNDIYCGAVIISKYWLITAAHCNHDYIQHVVAGISSIPEQNSSTVDSKYIFNITHIISHSHYNPKTFANDIALIRINRSLFNVAQPIIIASKDEQQTANKMFENHWVTHQDSIANLITSGWGKTNAIASNPYPEQLQLITLAGIPDHNCNGLHADHSHIICADSNINGLIKDICNGDSGGPLIWQNPQQINNNNFGLRVLGIASNGAQCEDRLNDPSHQYQQLHGQYTELAPLRSWIEDYIKKYDNLPTFSLATHNIIPNYKYNPFALVDDYPHDKKISSLLVSTRSNAAGNISLTVLFMLITITLFRERINLL